MHSTRILPPSSAVVRHLVGLLCLAGSLSTARADLLQSVQQDTATLAASSRMSGSEGQAEASSWLEQELAAIPGIQTWKQEFDLLMPVVNKATLTISSGPMAGEHEIFPLWPDMVRLNSTDDTGLSGEVLYIADGSLAELPASSLRGNIAAMEMSAYENWKRPFALNISAMLLLGSPNDQTVPPATQPLYFPRYYIPEGPLADEIRRNGLPESTVIADLEWKDVTATNHLALLMPEQASDLPAIGFAAAYDAMSIVIHQAPGADNAVDAAFLLNFAKETAATGTPRPVLFAFLDATTINQLGTRQFLSMLTVVETDKIRNDYVKKDSELLTSYQAMADAYASLGTGREALENIHNKREYRDIQRAFKDAIGPELLVTKETAAELRLEIAKSDDEAEKAALTADLQVKKDRIAFINRMLEQILTEIPVSDETLSEATRVFEMAGERITKQLEAQKARSNPYTANDALRDEILNAMGKPTGISPIDFLIGVDLSDSGSTVGPGLYDAHLKENATGTARTFTRWLKQALDDDATLFDSDALDLFETTLNQAALFGGDHPSSFNVGNTASLTSPASSFGMPGMTWKTLGGFPTRLDTPQDTAERLDWERLGNQILASKAVLTAAIQDSGFSPSAAKSGGVAGWRRPWGSIVSESVAETVPRTPMPGIIIGLVSEGDNIDKAPIYGARGIRRQEFVMSQADGGFTFFPMAGSVMPRGYARMQTLAYKLDDHGAITYAKADSTSMISGDMSSQFDIKAGATRGPVRLLAFPATEVNGPSFFDPRFLEPLSQYSLIDPMTGGQHKQSQFTVVEGQMWGAIREDATWQLILRAGTAANRMILMNLDPALQNNSEMKPQDGMRVGFSPYEPLPSFPAHIAAMDFYTIDSWRLDTFNRAGITSEVLQELHNDTADLLEQVDQAIAEDKGEKAGILAVAALANETRVYEALLATGSDVTRGAIFLMILIVPFAVAMERLMFAFAKIGHRIACSFGIFTVMALLLQSFHPAFRITNQPIIIVMAFAILLLSLLVIIMIFKKFEADLEEMRSGTAEKGGAQTTRGGVIGSAIWLGIANMRKRKLRTFLTAITIVLITFALLAFSSSTTYQDQRRFPVADGAPPYAGILLKNPGQAVMHKNALVVINSLAEGMNVSPRYWWTNSEPTWRLHARNSATGAQGAFKAALGLSELESDLTNPDQYLAGWDVFAEGNGAFISEAKATEMGLAPGDLLTVGGQELILAGTFSSQIEEQLTMLDGQSLLPYDFTIETDAEASSQAAQSGTAAIEEDEGDKLRVPPDDLIIIPAAVARDLGGDLRSIALPTASHEETLTKVNELSRILAFPLYYSTPDNTSVVAATPLIPQVPRNLITPLVLAALIIFNTMLNSVAERKKEIHIYTSLGLAPMHVGMLFLSEAVTYGLMGSVFGYIAGQGFAAVLTSFDLMGGITLNYSGSSVITTMSLVIGVVVLSSLVPAIMAGKLASPSDEMKWVVPDPVNGVISDQLPFTIHRDAAPGLMAFVHEYFVAHEEGTIGNFASADTRLLPKEGDTVTGLTGTLWLAPYDLGVRQQFALRVVPEGQEMDEICSITIEILHEAGQPNTWWRQNRAFLGALRKQLLGWRKVPADRILEYIDSFKTLHLSTNPQG